MFGLLRVGRVAFIEARAVVVAGAGAGSQRHNIEWLRMYGKQPKYRPCRFYLSFYAAARPRRCLHAVAVSSFSCLRLLRARVHKRQQHSRAGGSWSLRLRCADITMCV